MTTDLTTRILLTGILVCLLLLLVQRLGPAGEGALGARPAGEGAEAQAATRPGRFEITHLATRDGLVLLRTDTATGRLWQSEDLLEDGRWVAITEPPTDAGVEWGDFDEPTSDEEWVEWVESPEAPPAAEPEPELSGYEGDLGLLAGALSPVSPPDMQIWAAAQLADSTGDAVQVLQLLLDALQGDDPEVLVAVIGALERRRDPAAVAPLQTLLTHPDEQVRARAQEAISILRFE
jgi:hypothetical protein